MFTSSPSPKSFVLNFVLFFALLVGFLFPNGAARAYDFTVGSQAELDAAIVDANNETLRPGPDTITLRNNIVLTSGLSQSIASTITIEGAGYTLSRSTATGTPNFQILKVGSGEHPAGNLTVNNLTIANGDVSGPTGTYGGGILVSRRQDFLTVNFCTFRNNLANTGGGIKNDGTAFINNSTFYGNQATAAGGGGILNAGVMTIVNSTFSANRAFTYGGGIQNEVNNNFAGVTLTINYVTMTANRADSAGGAIRNDVTLNLNRSLISGNTAPSGAEVSQSTGSYTSVRNVLGHSGLSDAQAYNNFTPSGTDYNATNNLTRGFDIPLASILSPTLANNNGRTQTHALVAGSPAIDYVAIDGTTCTFNISDDQRRAVRGSGPNRGINACDSGAYEYNSTQDPSAITLNTFQAASGAPAWGIPLAFGLIGLAGLVFIVKRKR